MNNWQESQFILQKRIYESELFSVVNLTPSAKLFLWALCSHFNPAHATMFPSHSTMAKRLGMSERSVERATKELREVGLIEYVTKKVNHYVFTDKFFSLVKGENAPSESVSADSGNTSNQENCFLNTDKMSGDIRQNVGSDIRQNVGQTYKKEQINKKKVNFNFENRDFVTKAVEKNEFWMGEINKKDYLNKNKKYAKTPNSKVYGGVRKYYQDGGKAIPSIEETQKYIEEREKIRELNFNPANFTKEEALNWLNKADFGWLRCSRVARSLIRKYEFKDFYYLLKYEKPDEREGQKA